MVIDWKNYLPRIGCWPSHQFQVTGLGAETRFATDPTWQGVGQPCTNYGEAVCGSHFRWLLTPMCNSGDPPIITKDTVQKLVLSF